MDTTATQRDAIHSRDREERAGDGGLRHLTSWEVRKFGVGDWRVDFLYSDGTTTQVMGPHGGRGVPALA